MRLPVAISQPIEFAENSDPLLQRARTSYLNEWCRVEVQTPAKLDFVAQYDLEGMNRAVTICHWGRSGSFLLSSYLDGHPDLLSLPAGNGESVYPFYLKYRSLSVWEKLIAYPLYSEAKTGTFGDFFLRDNPNGHFAIGAADYYAGVQALFDTYRARPPEWLNSSFRFVQFIHVAYDLAIARRRTTRQPLLICSQHWMNQELAEHFLRDFPAAQFIHTIRDPITCIDSWFSWKMQKAALDSKDASYSVTADYCDNAVATMLDLLSWDRPHRGMGARTRTIRFEDMHLAPEAVMRRLAAWLAIPYLPCLLDSTWNGNPYVVNVRGVPCCGPRVSNAERRFENLAPIDRLLVFALFDTNFVEWRYPAPSPMHRRWIQLCVLVLIMIVPLKIEIKNARMILASQALPSLRNHRVGFAAGAMLFLLQRRLRMMLLIAKESTLRLSRRRPILQVL